MGQDEQGPGGEAGGLSPEVEAFLRQALSGLPDEPGAPPRPAVAPEVVAVQQVYLALALLVSGYHNGLLKFGVDGQAALVLSSQFQGDMLAHARAAVAIMADRLRRAAGQQ